MVRLNELDELRRKRKDTYAAVGEAMGTSKQNAQQIFAGRQRLSLEQAGILARRYSMDAETACRIFGLLGADA